MHVDHVGAAIKVHVPHLLGNESTRKDFSRTTREQREQRKLLGREIQFLARTDSSPLEKIDLEIRKPQDLLMARWPTPQHGTNPRKQLREGERLHQVVVGAEVEAPNSVVHAVSGGEKQDWSLHRGVPQLRGHGPAVDLGKHDVKNDDVVLAGPRQVKPFLAVSGHIDSEPLLSEAFFEISRSLFLIFDHEYFHVCDLQLRAGHGATMLSRWTQEFIHDAVPQVACNKLGMYSGRIAIATNAFPPGARRSIPCIGSTHRFRALAAWRICFAPLSMRSRKPQNMDAKAIFDSTEALSRAFQQTRAERQHRRSLDPADFASLRNAGFHLLALPVEHGGLWRGVQESVRPLCRALRGIASGDSSVALVASMHPAVLSYWLTAPPASSDQSWSAQRKEVFESVVGGNWWGTITSEPGSAGDIRKTRTKAKRAASSRGYLLSGAKHFGSGSGITSYMVTTAQVEGEAEPDWFFLDLRSVPWDGSRGVTLLAEWDGHGMTATQSHAMAFNDFPATRFALEGKLLEVSRRAGPFIMCLFTSVIAGIVEVAIQTAMDSITRRDLSAFEKTEWTRACMEGWLAEQALEGMLRAVERDEDPRLATLQGKTLVAELAETILTRICRVLGGATFSRRSPFGHWLEDVRALGFLRPPWSLAFEMLSELQQAQQKSEA